nr:hypothetical protein [uncultured Campylobacter sp.]
MGFGSFLRDVGKSVAKNAMNKLADMDEKKRAYASKSSSELRNIMEEYSHRKSSSEFLAACYHLKERGEL